MEIHEGADSVMTYDRVFSPSADRDYLQDPHSSVHRNSRGMFVGSLCLNINFLPMSSNASKRSEAGTLQNGPQTLNSWMI